MRLAEGREAAHRPTPAIRRSRNWLARRGATAMPTPFGRYDAICLLAGAAAMLLRTVRPDLPLGAPFRPAPGALAVAAECGTEAGELLTPAR